MRSGPLTVFLCGDVMTGRGIDQIMRHPSAPLLHERAVEDAREYVELAEARNGPIPRRVDPSYIWGEALEELERVKPDARIVNMETSITRSNEFWPDKEVHYRMHPYNAGCLTAARIDVCTLANNHVLDWGVTGLLETIAALATSGIATAGAGGNAREAQQPASVEMGSGKRLLVFALGSETSGIPPSWAATEQSPGVDLLEDLSPAAAARVASRLLEGKRPGDLAIASIHWGTNWGYEVSPSFVDFAHRLVDAGFDVVHGHSSHHVRPIEVFRDRLILYGCGDFIDDYEGIEGYEAFRDDLTLMYFATLDAASGALEELRMVPMQIRNFRLARPSRGDVEWLRETVAGCSAPFGSSVELGADGSLLLRWGHHRAPGSQRGMRGTAASVSGSTDARRARRARSPRPTLGCDEPGDARSESRRPRREGQMAIVRKSESVPIARREWDPFETMREMTRWDPFREFMRWEPLRELRRLWPAEERVARFEPDVDVRETKDALLFKADVPGMREEDVDVNLAGNRLTISGKREVEEEAPDTTLHCCERGYGSFTRSFTLPQGIDAEHVAAEMKDGVITIRIPKSEQTQSKRIPVGGKMPAAAGKA